MGKDDEHSLLLNNARLVLPDRVVEEAAIQIKGERIAGIEAASDGATDQTVVDLQGLTVFPGFIDVHIHGALGVDTTDASASALGSLARHLATKGVTAWLPTFVPAATGTYQRSIAALAETISKQASKSSGARVLGVHYEGPFVSRLQCGALHEEFFQTFSGAELDELPRVNLPEARHMMTVAPEIEGGIELVKALRARGWIVSLGHTRADLAVLDQALAAGARHMTHFMNAMAPLHHRSPGPIAWGLLHDDVTCDLIADGVHLDPNMLRLLLKLKGAERITLISDAIAATGFGDGDYPIWGETITVKDGKTSNVHGSIAGSVIMMDDAVRLMLALGASEPEAARMAATNPARLLGLDHERGSIEIGKQADLVVLDEAGKVQLTLVGGRKEYGTFRIFAGSTPRKTEWDEAVL
ncbi:MAG TPA: N-acetylglucosamine-6-phosphate deacetylase [Pyrinomonadaceae bacterium]|nr:N-acetylglucosamine-6-phosphate deacetylase [Pyrinomonadaceae bacterium]